MKCSTVWRSHLPAECRHGIRPEWCAICRSVVVHAPTLDVEDGLAAVFAVTHARITGLCPGGCDQDIAEGEKIYLVDGEWVNARCAREAV